MIVPIDGAATASKKTTAAPLRASARTAVGTASDLL